MHRLIIWLSILTGLFAIFVTYRLIVLTQEGAMLWLVLDSGANLTEDGVQIKGWLHREWKGRFLIVTRNGGPAGRESYIVLPSSRRGAFVQDCDEWTATRLPVLPFPEFVSDALSCPGWGLPLHFTHYSPPTISSNSVEFVDERGRRLQIRWK